MTTKQKISLATISAFVVLAGLIPAGLKAQSVARRIASTGSGKVRMTFASRPDICGSGNSISHNGNDRTSWSSDRSPDVEYDEECSHSPVRLVLDVDGGRVTKIRTYVGGRWRPAAGSTTDLGAVPVRDATDFLIGLASSDEGSVGRDAILPATLADSVVVWPPLFRIARDEARPIATRKQALFWLGQAASDRISARNSYLAKNDDATEVKKSAVFALSQRRNGEAVPALIEVAKNNHDPEVRKSALFWLGQTSDPRAISLFEEILGARSTIGRGRVAGTRAASFGPVYVIR